MYKNFSTTNNIPRFTVLNPNHREIQITRHKNNKVSIFLKDFRQKTKDIDPKAVLRKTQKAKTRQKTEHPINIKRNRQINNKTMI